MKELQSDQRKLAEERYSLERDKSDLERERDRVRDKEAKATQRLKEANEAKLVLFIHYYNRCHILMSLCAGGRAVNTTTPGTGRRCGSQVPGADARTKLTQVPIL